MTSHAYGGNQCDSTMGRAGLRPPQEVAVPPYDDAYTCFPETPWGPSMGWEPLRCQQGVTGQPAEGNLSDYRMGRAGLAQPRGVTSASYNVTHSGFKENLGSSSKMGEPLLPQSSQLGPSQSDVDKQLVVHDSPTYTSAGRLTHIRSNHEIYSPAERHMGSSMPSDNGPVSGSSSVKKSPAEVAYGGTTESREDETRPAPETQSGVDLTAALQYIMDRLATMGSGDSSKKKGTCHFCGRPGHYQRECRRRKRQEQEYMVLGEDKPEMKHADSQE